MRRITRWMVGAGGALATLLVPPSWAVPLSDVPIFASMNVPGNVALALSVEYPTGISVANLGNYLNTKTYYGYFDPDKCYDYVTNTSTPDSSYFQPAAKATNHACTGKWSGNFMNWVTMQTIDPFRWALTGGYRSVDSTDGITILQKALAPSNNTYGSAEFPDRGTLVAASAGSNLPASDVAKVTPV